MTADRRPLVQHVPYRFDVGHYCALHGLTGELVPAANPEALAESLLKLARDPTMTLAMGRAGRASAEARFSMQSKVSGYSGIYDRQPSSLT